MAFSSEDLTAIEKAIKSGVRTVKIDGKEVTYASLPEMLQVRDLIRKELGQTSTSSTRVKANFDKGVR